MSSQIESLTQVGKSSTEEAWFQVSLGEILRNRDERGLDSDPLLSVTATRGVVPHAETGRRDISNQDKSNYRAVYEGDIVYNTMRMWQGVSGISRHEGIVSPAYTVCEPSERVHAAFVAHLLRLPELVQRFRERSQGLVSDTWNLRYSEFSKISVRIPDLNAQRRIATILDTLDDQIGATEKIIAKMKCIEDALLTDSLSAYSGRFERQLGDILAVPPKNGYSPVAAQEWMGSYMLGLGCLTAQGFVPRQLKNAPVGDLRLRPALLRDGDVLMSRSNTPDLVGLAGVFRDVGAPCFYPDLMMRLVPSSSLGSDYLAIALNSFHVRRQIMNVASGTSGSMVKIGRRAVSSLRLPVPPHSEQNRIVSIVEQGRSTVDFEVKRLEKLRLLKAGLLSDLLTGQTPIPGVSAA